MKEFGETLTQIIGPVEVSRGFVHTCMPGHPASCCWVLVLWLPGLGACWNTPVCHHGSSPEFPSVPAHHPWWLPAETVTESKHFSSWMEDTGHQEGTAPVISVPFSYISFSSYKINTFSYCLGLLILLQPNCTVYILKAHVVTDAVLPLDLCNLQYFIPLGAEKCI